MGYLFAIAAAVAWGLAYNINQKILVPVSPLGLLFIHSSLVALIASVFLLLRGNFTSVLISTKGIIPLLFLLACLGALANYSSFSAIKFLNAPTASILEITYPLFVALFAFLLFGKQFSVPFFVGAFLILLGSTVIIRWG